MKTPTELAKEKGVTRQAVEGHALRAGISKNKYGKYSEADARRILDRIGSKPGPKTGPRRRRAA